MKVRSKGKEVRDFIFYKIVCSNPTVLSIQTSNPDTQLVLVCNEDEMAKTKEQ